MCTMPRYPAPEKTDHRQATDPPSNTMFSLANLVLLGDTPFKILQVLNGVFLIHAKWFVGVLLRKLLDASYQTTGPLELTTPTNALLNFIFLYELSFPAVALLAILAFIMGSFSTALLGAVSYSRSTTKGRLLRHEIVEKVDKSCTEGANITRLANDLLIHVKVIEDYMARDEKWIVSNITVIFVSGVLSTIFLWHVGLLAIGCFFLAEIVKAVFDASRKKHLESIHKAAGKVNSRLVDIVKNAVKIKMMDQTGHELLELARLENESDLDRRQDLWLLFLRDISKHAILSVIPCAMAWMTYAMIQSADSTSEAIDMGAAVVAAFVLLEEGHKNMITLHFTSDKKVGADDAQASIDAFLRTSPQEALSSRSGHGDTDITLNTNPSLTEHNLAVQDLEKVEPSPRPFSFRKVCQNDSPELSFSNISCSYPGRDTPVLDDFNLSFQRGMIHGLVGESGSGKSTLLKIVASLVTPQTGLLTHWTGMKVAYVNQDQKIFARTVRENTIYGNDGPVNDEAIWQALTAANVADWVLSLPKGLDEELIDGESSVSGGQLQRLNLAHLFCTCQGADVVVLDEVLSALDPASRDYLITQLGSFLAGKTAIVITHHSEMLRICDQVHEISARQNISAEGEWHA